MVDWTRLIVLEPGKLGGERCGVWDGEIKPSSSSDGRGGEMRTNRDLALVAALQAICCCVSGL